MDPSDCAICDERHEGTHYCTNCEMAMCTTMANIHTKQKVYKTHVVRAEAELLDHLKSTIEASLQELNQARSNLFVEYADALPPRNNHSPSAVERANEVFRLCIEAGAIINGQYDALCTAQRSLQRPSSGRATPSHPDLFSADKKLKTMLFSTDLAIKTFKAGVVQLKALPTWGNFGGQLGSYHYPVSVAISPHDEVYVCNGRKYTVQVFTMDGALLRTWDVPKAMSRDSHYPVGIAVAPWNEVYVIKQHPTHVYVFRTDGSFVRTWNYISALESVDCAKPVGISTASNGEVFVLHKRVRVFKPDGTFSRSWEVACEDDEPRALCVAFGEVYVISKTACYVYDMNGNHLAHWTGLSGARHVSVSPQGRVYVAEENGVRMFEHGRAVQNCSDAKNPLAVAVGPDRLFVCRSDTHTIETITLKNT